LAKKDGPLIPGFENYTVFLKNSISFPRMGEEYTRKNMKPNTICVYKEGDEPEK
jgi:hypothetical protein